MQDTGASLGASMAHKWLVGSFLVLHGLPIVTCKWRTMPSAFHPPGLFENVCIGRDTENTPAKIYFAAPAITTSRTLGTPPPTEISVGTLSRSSKVGFHTVYPPESPHEPHATVVMTAHESPHTMASSCM